jgi:IS1 family transposase
MYKEKTMNAKQCAKFLNYVMWYFRNVPKKEIIKKIYGDGDESHQAYLVSKLAMIERDELYWFSDLDDEHREKFCQLVIDKYEKK